MKPSPWDPAALPGWFGLAPRPSTPASKVRRLTPEEIAAEYGARAHRPKPPPVKGFRWNWNRKGANR